MTKMSKKIYLTRLLESCDGRNHGQKNKTKKTTNKKNKTKKHWNEIQKPSAWYALGLKTRLNIIIKMSLELQSIIYGWAEPSSATDAFWITQEIDMKKMLIINEFLV